LGLGDVDQDLSGGVDDVEELHDGGAVVGDGDVALIVVDEFIHTSRPQRAPHHVCNRRASIYVAHKLRLSLRRVRSFFQKYDLRLLFDFSCAFPQRETDTKLVRNYYYYYY
jgi:hypothetical protein